MCVSAAKQFPEAISDFSAAIELEPKLADAYKRRGQVFAAMGKVRVQWCFVALHSSPSLPFTSLHLAFLPFLSLPFPSFPFLSLPFPSFPFLSLPFPSFPFPSFPSLSFLSLSFLPFPFLPSFLSSFLPFLPTSLIVSVVAQAREALVDLSHAITLEPVADSYYQRGNSLYKLGDFRSAAVDFTRATELDPSHAEAWHMRAQADMSLGLLDQALSSFRRTLRLNPKVRRSLAAGWSCQRVEWRRAVSVTRALVSVCVYVLCR